MKAGCSEVMGEGRRGHSAHVKLFFRTDPGCTTEKRDKASEPNGSSWSLSSLPEGPSLKNQDHLRPKLEAGDEGWRAGSGSKGACYQA